MGCVESAEGRSKRKYLEMFRPKSKPCKAGYLLYFSDETNKWKKVFVILFQDSTLAWFTKPKQKQPLGHVMLQNVCSMLVVGPVCTKIPTCPKSLPKKMSYSFMIAFPQFVLNMSGPGAMNSPVRFFLCPNGNAMGGWMTSIAGTLPPPANPYAMPGQPAPSAPPQPGYNAYNTGTPAYPPGGPAYQPQYGHAPQTTTVVKQYKRKHSNDYTAGFLAGACIGFGYGYPWGWGWGWGWAYHPCYGWGYGDFDMDVDVDVHVHNDIDIETGSVASFGGDDFQDFGNDTDGNFDYNNGDTGGYEGADFGMANYDDGGGGGGGDYGGGDYGGWGGGDYGGGGDGGGGGGGGCGGSGCGGGGCGGGGCGGGGCGG